MTVSAIEAKPSRLRRQAPLKPRSPVLQRGDRLIPIRDAARLLGYSADTLRYRLLGLPARLVRHARQRVLKISRTWPWKEAFLICWQRLFTLPAPA